MSRNGRPFQCNCTEHEEAVNKMIENAKSLTRANFDSSVLVKTKQKTGENVTEFIYKFKTLFDRQRGESKGLKGSKEFFNQLLMDGLHPYLKQAIITHDPLWKSKTFDDIITLAEHYENSIAPPQPLPKIQAVLTPDGHVTLHPPHDLSLKLGSGASRQQRQPGHHPGNTPRTPVCWSCGTIGHCWTHCPQPNAARPFKPTNRQARLIWPRK